MIRDLLSRDHERLDVLLACTLREDGFLDQQAYGEFRQGLLRHIGIEERVLFPALRNGARFADVERRLHRDHAALAALLVPPPTRKEIEAIRMILADHNGVEEARGGVYDAVDELSNAESIAEAVVSFPAVALAPHSDTPLLRTTIERLLRERTTDDVSR